MPEIQTTIEFEVYCAKHPRSRLDAEIRMQVNGVHAVIVKPCEECLDEMDRYARADTPEE